MILQLGDQSVQERLDASRGEQHPIATKTRAIAVLVSAVESTIVMEFSGQAQLGGGGRGAVNFPVVWLMTA